MVDTPRKRNCIGADPASAKPSVFAWHCHPWKWNEDQRKWEIAGPKEWHVESWNTAHEFYCCIDAAMPHEDDVLVVIEDGYIGTYLGKDGRTKVNKSCLDLAVVRGEIKAAAEIACEESRFVAPNTWQVGKSGVCRGLGIKATSKQRKPVYMEYAKRVTGRDDLNEDEAAAVCIAAWANSQHWEED